MRLFISFLQFAFLVTPVVINLPTPLLASFQMQLSPQAALERLFTAPQLQADWFDVNMLNQFPLPQAQQFIDDMQRDLGAYQRVEPAGEH